MCSWKWPLNRSKIFLHVLSANCVHATMRNYINMQQSMSFLLSYYCEVAVLLPSVLVWLPCCTHWTERVDHPVSTCRMRISKHPLCSRLLYSFGMAQHAYSFGMPEYAYGTWLYIVLERHYSFGMLIVLEWLNMLLTESIPLAWKTIPLAWKLLTLPRIGNCQELWKPAGMFNSKPTPINRSAPPSPEDCW